MNYLTISYMVLANVLTLNKNYDISKIVNTVAIMTNSLKQSVSEMGKEKWSGCMHTSELLYF